MTTSLKVPTKPAVTRVRSRDGSRIAYWTIGAGPGVLLIPGVLSQAKDYAVLAATLGESFTVHTLERRGRGESGPQGPYYDMDRECEDVRAVQEATGAELLFGHSYGGLIALESARGRTPFTKLAVYEPGVSVGGSISIDWAEPYARALKQGRPLDAFAHFLIASGPDSARRLPFWAMRVMLPRVIGPEALAEKFALLHENLKEHEVISRLNDGYGAYRSIKAEVLLMFGGKSRLPWVPKTVAALGATVPRLTVQRFAKLDHFAPDRSRPRQVAARIVDFFQTDASDRAPAMRSVEAAKGARSR